MTAKFSIWLAVLLAATVAADASASEADIGGVKFTLPPIEGYCELRGNDPSEAKLLDVAREVRAGKSLVLAMYGECKELERWKTGEQPYLDNHIVITSLLKYRDKIIPDDPDKWAAQVCELSKDKSFTQSKGIKEDVEKRIANLSLNLKLNEMQTISLAAKDTGVCYIAMVTKLQAEGGDEKNQIGAGSTMLLKGKIIYIYTVTLNDGPKALERSLPVTKAVTAAVAAANR